MSFIRIGLNRSKMLINKVLTILEFLLAVVTHTLKLGLVQENKRLFNVNFFFAFCFIVFWTEYMANY